jgi:viroplasmin and RNaseH domain-containing protein
MTNYTQNLNLYKIDPLKDGNKTFNINTILNDNWDKIDIKHKQQETRVNQNKDETIILRNDIGNKSALNTTDKSNLVSAVNEVSASMADIAYKTVGGTANAITITKQGFTLTDGQYVEFKGKRQIFTV